MYPKAEYQYASTILMHTPSYELFDGVIHPSAALYQGYFNAEEATKEHQNYIAALKNHGINVYVVREILERSALDSLRVLAGKCLTYDTSKLKGVSSDDVESYRLSIINKMTKADLIRTILLRPTVQLTNSNINTGVQASYIQAPLMNLFFARDQMINTAKGSIICRMNSVQRATECDVMDYCLSQIGMPAIYKIKGKNSYLEGGDFIPMGDMALIGQGLRTSQEAIDELLENDLLGTNTLVVVRDHWLNQEQMHLDTYFNVMDRDLVSMSARRLRATPESNMFLTVDIYSRPNSAQPYQKTVEGVPFVEFLKDRGISIIPIEREDEAQYAGNYLCIAPRHVMVVAGQTTDLRQRFVSHNVKAEYIPLDNLIQGYGAAHCMTQVLQRTDSEK